MKQAAAKPNGAAPPPPDAADIAALWTDTGLDDPLTTTTLHSVPVGKPRDFFRVHPDKDHRRSCAIYVHKSENMIGEEYYIIGHEMRGRMTEARPCVLVCVVDRAGLPRLWPLMQPRDGERDNAAWVTARSVAKEGLKRWVRLVWVGRSFTSRGADDGYAPDPDWSKVPPFDELARKAFGDNGIIRDENHPIYRDLFGKVTKSDVAGDDIAV